MAKQYDITDFGEGLVSRQRQQRKRRQKRATRNAWRQGLAMAGMNMINRGLQTKANEFLQSEEAMAVKARYASANEQAQRIIQMRSDAAEQGLSMPEYFMTNTYLPQVTAAFQEQYGTKYKPESYAPQLREIAWDLAQQEASEFELAMAKAMEVPAWEEVNQNLNELMTPPRSAGQALIGKVRGLFGGKSEDQVRQEVLERLDQEGAIRNDSYRRYFDKVLVDKGFDEAVARVRAIAPSDEDRISILKDAIDIKSVPGQGIVITKMTTESDGEGNVRLVGEPETTVVDTRTEEGRVAAIQETLNVDLIGNAEELMNIDGRAMMHRIMAERGINSGNLMELKKTEDGKYAAPHYMYMAEQVNRLMADPNNLSDPDRDQRIVDLYTAFVQLTQVDIQSLISDPERLEDHLLALGEWSRTFEVALMQRGALGGGAGNPSSFSELD